ncbi:MAG: galactokinase [Acidobacteriota bacterium]
MSTLYPAAMRASALCASAFGYAPQVMAAAPGRVNLIGEHTDYNEGFVLPLAINRATVCAGRLTDDRRVELVSGSARERATIELDADVVPRGLPRWTNYLRGVIAGFQRRGMRLSGLQIAIESDVPVGGGLSSSAALEVATATMLQALTGHPLSPAETIALCRQAEHEYAGVPCGVMDQTAVVLAREGHALLLDCRSLDVAHVPFIDPDVCLLIVNTSVRHSLASGEYARRRAECAAAAAQLGVTTLRDASAADVADQPRARHVVSENARTLAAVEALRMSDWPRLGRLMYESHLSLRDDFEVSCAELDAVVEIARDIGEPGGVWGCRMTGGGFGGCAVCLVRSTEAAAISDRIAGHYRSATGLTATIFPARAARGAHLVQIRSDE